jgi:hypothetical protein
MKAAYGKVILPFENYAAIHRDSVAAQFAAQLKEEDSPKNEALSGGEDIVMTDATAPGSKQAKPRKRMMGKSPIAAAATRPCISYPNDWCSWLVFDDCGSR